MVSQHAVHESVQQTPGNPSSRSERFTVTYRTNGMTLACISAIQQLEAATLLLLFMDVVAYDDSDQPICLSVGISTMIKVCLQ